MCYSLSCVFKQNCVQLEFDYCWKPVCVVCLAEFEKKKPKDLHILYPSAAAKAVRLIGHMLKMEPNLRISAVDALSNPYLSRYHEPDDEPICVPVFEFSFEKQVQFLLCCFTVKIRILFLQQLYF